MLRRSSKKPYGKLPNEAPVTVIAKHPGVSLQSLYKWVKTCVINATDHCEAEMRDTVIAHSDQGSQYESNDWCFLRLASRSPAWIDIATAGTMQWQSLSLATLRKNRSNNASTKYAIPPRSMSSITSSQFTIIPAGTVILTWPVTRDLNMPQLRLRDIYKTGGSS